MDGLTARAEASTVQQVNNVYPRRSVLRPGIPQAIVLVLACAAQLMVILDGLVVNIALPVIFSDVGMSRASLPWVVNGYLLTFGGFLLVASRITDIAGHRRVVLVGIGVLTVASLAGGLAQGPATLIAARVVQGVGAAALAPSSLSMVTATHDGANRARALAIWSATSSAAGALGLMLGGAITGLLGWRWVLLINVPIGVVLWGLAAAILAPAAATVRQPIDIPGALTTVFGLGALTYGISQTEVLGWWSARVVFALGLAGVMFALFIAAERRSAHPLVPLDVLRRRSILVANTVIAVLGAIMTATMYFLSLYLQQVVGAGPLDAGLTLLPMSAVLTIGALASKVLLSQFGIRPLIAMGGVLMAAGLFWLADITSSGGSALSVVGPSLLWAAGASVVIMPCVALATVSVDSGQAGLAAGLVNTARGSGGVIGLAILVTVAGSVTARFHAADDAMAVVRGYSAALAGAAILAIAIIVLGALAPRARGRSD